MKSGHAFFKTFASILLAAGLTLGFGFEVQAQHHGGGHGGHHGGGHGFGGHHGGGHGFGHRGGHSFGLSFGRGLHGFGGHHGGHHGSYIPRYRYYRYYGSHSYPYSYRYRHRSYPYRSYSYRRPYYHDDDDRRTSDRGIYDDRLSDSNAERRDYPRSGDERSGDYPRTGENDADYPRSSGRDEGAINANAQLSTQGWDRLASGDYSGALNAFAGQAESNPDRGIPKVGYALAAAAGGNLDRGVWAMRRAFRMDPKGVEYLVVDDELRPVVAETLDAYAAAAEGDADHAFMQAALLYLLGDAPAADRTLARLTGDADQSTRNLMDAVDRRLAEHDTADAQKRTTGTLGTVSETETPPETAAGDDY